MFCFIRQLHGNSCAVALKSFRGEAKVLPESMAKNKINNDYQR